MAMLQQIRPATRLTAAAGIFLGGAVLSLVLSSRNQPGLAASGNVARVDFDQDGLTDLQELVLGTRPDQADSDHDGFSDLEERARASDPLDPSSQPIGSPLAVGTFASADLGFVSLAYAVYVAGGKLRSVDFQIGVVLDGKPIRSSPSDYSLVRTFIHDGQAGGDRIAIVELAIPETLVRRMGQLNLFAVARGVGDNPPPPAVSTFSLADFSGVTVSIEPSAPFTVSETGSGIPRGVIYRPLAGDEQLPVTWSGGEVCWQKTTPVGMNGVSIVHEVESADCLPMDTYCSGADCAASVGKPLEMPDPGALVGG